MNANALLRSSLGYVLPRSMANEQMTRDEAIGHIRGLSQSVAHEYCCSQSEEDLLEQQTEEAIATLSGLAPVDDE